MRLIVWKGGCVAVSLLLMAGGCAEKPRETLPPGQPVVSPSPGPSTSKRASKTVTPKTTPRPAAPAPDPTPASSPRLLSPDPTGEQHDRWGQEAIRKIELAEQLATRVDQKQLTREQRDTFLTVQNFLSKAKEALAVDDLPRALTLADKAHTLVGDLPTSPPP